MFPSKILLGLRIITMLLVTTGLWSCSDDDKQATGAKSETKHHLHIPDGGIESLMEANSQKIIEGTDGSVVIMIGNVTRKEADITIKQEEKILVERMIGEEEDMSFNYEGISYTLHTGKIKKPLLGEGKVQISIK